MSTCTNLCCTSCCTSACVCVSSSDVLAEVVAVWPGHQQVLSDSVSACVRDMCSSDSTKIRSSEFICDTRRQFFRMLHGTSHHHHDVTSTTRYPRNHPNCKFDQYKMRPWLLVAVAVLAALPAGLAVDYAGELCATVVDFSLEDGTDFAQLDQLVENTYAMFPRWVTRVRKAEMHHWLTRHLHSPWGECVARHLYRIASPRCGSCRA